MAEKVFEVRGDVDINTKDAERAINRMAHSTRAFGDSMLQADRISISLTRRLRSGFDTGMVASLKRNEGGLLAFGNALQVAGAGLKKIENESVLALRSFQRLQRGGAVVQTALGALAGSIGDLSGGVLSLVGILGQAAYAFTGVGTALMGVVGGFAVAKIAMSGVGKAVSQLWNGQTQYNRSLRDARKELKDLKFDLEGAVLSEQEAAIELEKARTQLAMAQDLPPDNMVRREAELAFQRADLNYRRAKSRVNDLQDTIKRGGNVASRAANADPFKNLTKSQITFAKYLATLKPLMQGLKEAAAFSFLPPLQNGIQNLTTTLLPSLMTGFKQLGSAMGYAAERFAGTFNRPDNLKAFQDFFTDSEPRLRQLGDASSKFLGGFFKLMQSSKPVTDRFIVWIDSVASRFNAMADSESTKRFLAIAGYVASQLGHVFGNFGDGIKNIMDANFPPGGGGAGQVLLDWLNGIALGFKKFTGSETFAKWLKDSTENATAMLSVIGDFLHIFLDLAGRPEVKEFWTTLGKSIPDITKVLLDGVKAAPAFSKLLVSVINLFSAFSDSGALIVFFDTLRSITDVFGAIFNNPVIKGILDWLGRIHFWVLAVSGVMTLLTLGGVAFMAIVGQIVKNLGRLLSMVVGTTNWMARFNTELAVSKPGIVAWGKALWTSLYGTVAASEKGSKALTLVKASYAQLRQAILNYITATQWLNESVGRVSTTLGSLVQKLKALKASVMDTALSIRTSLTAAMQKFKDVAGTALGNAKFALYTTLIQNGRLVSDFYNTRVIPVMNKFRDIVVNKFNDARLAIYGTLQQKGRMVADLYNTRVVPAFQRFLAAVSPQAIRTKMMGFAMGMMMHIDLIDKRIVPAFMRLGAGIKNGITLMQQALNPANIKWQLKQFKFNLGVWVQTLKRILSPENIRLTTLGFRMGMMFHIDLLSKSIVPAFARIRDGIKTSIAQIGTALSQLGTTLSLRNIQSKMLGFKIGMMMQIDLIDKRIIPAFQRLKAGFITLSMQMRSKVSLALYNLNYNFKLLGFTIRQNITDVQALSTVLGREIVAKFNKFKTAVMQSTAMIKLQTAATKLATAAHQMWSRLNLPNVFRSMKDSLTGFIDRMKAKTATVQASTAADVAATIASKNKTKALTEEQKAAAAAAAAGSRRVGGGMALMGAGMAAQGLISGAANGGMSAGSALTTLGGAMMFIPGGMIAGLAVGIVGAIVQGFEAAENKARERKMEIVARNVQITAERVQTATAQITDELTQLLSTGNYNYDTAQEEINRRRRVVTDAATAAGADSGELQDVRKAFLNAGVAATGPTMQALIEAAAVYSSKSPDSTADQISQAILSVFKDKNVQGVVDTFGSIPDTAAAATTPTTAPFAPGVAPQKPTPPAFTPTPTQQSTIDDGSGVLISADIPVTAVFDKQVARIKKILGDPKSYSIDATENKFGFNVSSPALNPKLLSGFSKSAVEAALSYALEKNLKPSTIGVLESAITGKPAYANQPGFGFSTSAAPKFALPSVRSIDSDKIGGLYTGASERSFDFSTGKITTTTAGKPGEFTTSQIQAIKGTKRDPSIVQLIPAPGEVAGIASISDYTSKTANALGVISGLVDPDGGGLKVIDLSPRDKTAPQIMIAPGMSISEQDQINRLNAALRKAFGQ